MSTLGCVRALVMAFALGLSLASAAGPAEDAAAAHDRGDFATAIRIWTTLAEQGDPAAQSNLGVVFQNGHGVTKDDKLAVQWFQKAALQGLADAQDNLGIMYANGRGVDTDDAAAVEWFRKAAEQGNAPAQYNLGVMHASGRGVPQDDSAALQWFRKSAEQGNAAAQYNLGAMYRDGRGVAPDPAAALQWFRQAAEQGNAQALEVLGAMAMQERDAAALAATIATLVRKYEAAQPVAPVPDAERAALAREVIALSEARAQLPLSSEQLREALGNQRASARISPSLLAAFHAAAVASFRLDRILASWERGLAATLDAATLRTGLEWERSDLGRRIRHLELEAAKPEQLAAMKEFARQHAVGGVTTGDERGRACARKGSLDNSSDHLLPVFGAFVAAGAMAEATRKGQAMDMDGIARAVVAMRPLLREMSRQAELTGCVYTLRDLSAAEFEQWLDFLRTDAGGRYARGRNAALRTALLEVAEVFTRTLVDVTRQPQVGRAS